MIRVTSPPCRTGSHPSAKAANIAGLTFVIGVVAVTGCLVADASSSWRRFRCGPRVTRSCPSPTARPSSGAGQRPLPVLIGLLALVSPPPSETPQSQWALAGPSLLPRPGSSRQRPFTPTHSTDSANDAGLAIQATPTSSRFRSSPGRRQRPCRMGGRSPPYRRGAVAAAGRVRVTTSTCQAGHQGQAADQLRRADVWYPNRRQGHLNPESACRCAPARKRPDLAPICASQYVAPPGRRSPSL